MLSALFVVLMLTRAVPPVSAASSVTSWVSASLGPGEEVSPPAFSEDREAVNRLVRDYIGLYRSDALEKWRELFLPTCMIASTNADGTTTVRTLGEFYSAQKRRFDEGRRVSEVLENVQIEQRGRLAGVWADFVFTEEGSSRRGRLAMLLMGERGVFRIHSLLFSYHG